MLSRFTYSLSGHIKAFCLCKPGFMSLNKGLPAVGYFLHLSQGPIQWLFASLSIIRRVQSGSLNFSISVLPIRQVLKPDIIPSHQSPRLAHLAWGIKSRGGCHIDMIILLWIIKKWLQKFPSIANIYQWHQSSRVGCRPRLPHYIYAVVLISLHCWLRKTQIVLHKPSWHVEESFYRQGPDVDFDICLAIEIRESEARERWPDEDFCSGLNSCVGDCLALSDFDNGAGFVPV